MSPIRSFCLSSVLSILVAMPLVAASAVHGSPSREVGANSSANPEFVPADRDPYFSTFNRSSRALSKAAGDSVAIFGGPGTVEGKFQDALDGGLPDTQGWISVDETDEPMHWQISTFNASRLDTTVVGNHGYWCGELDPTGWAAAPGYGNSWNNSLGFDWVVPDPGQPHAVRLNFVFHHDSEPGYDFFRVEVDSAGSWVSLGTFTGYNGTQNWGDPPQTPVVFDRTVQFQGNDYSGAGDRVSFRLRFTSDGAWSDEDGLWPTPFGAVQVDNINVDVDGANISSADFEGSAGDADWSEIRPPFAGDFFKVLVGLVDLDPCRENDSPVATFIDDGTPPNNAPGQSTGGSFAQSSAVAAAYENSAVVNYTGGLSMGSVPLSNSIVSPAFPWDNPNTTADNGLDDGAFLRFDVYQDLPLMNGLFFRWSIRSRAVGGDWGVWKDRNFVYYSDPTPPGWLTKQIDLRDLVEDAPESVQIDLGVVDLAGVFGFPGLDATPSPYFDNVGFFRYDHGGPSIAIRSDGLFQDAFPNRDAPLATSPLADHAVRIDVGSFASGFSNDAQGDSMVVEVTANGVGVSLTGPPIMEWALEANPRYATVRSLPAGAVASATTSRGWTIYTGEVVGAQVTTTSGQILVDHYFFDLPDGFGRTQIPSDADEAAMFFPGDRLRFAVSATDDLGRTKSLPLDTSALISGGGYDPAFTVRALPTLLDPPVNQPKLLIWQDGGHQTQSSDLSALTWSRGQYNELDLALSELGMEEGVDYDVFVSRGDRNGADELGASEGLGATVDQISQYTVLLYDAEERFVFPQDGTDVYGWGGSPTPPFSSTIAAIDSWRNLDGNRTAIWMGDDFLTAGAGLSGATFDFISNSMGVIPQDAQVLDDIGGEVNPVVSLTTDGALAGLSSNVDFFVRSGCLALRDFDAISEGPNTIVTHRFVLDGGSMAMNVAAGLLYERVVNGYTKRDFTFPFGLSAIDDPSSPGNDPRAARAALLGDLFTLAGLPTAGGVVPAPQALANLVVERARPNPFNPATEIRWSAPASGRLKIEVHDLRGRRVATLLDGEVPTGAGKLLWEGRDGRGISVASGVYLISVEGFGRVERQKVVLVE